METDIADVRVRAGEDREVVHGEHRHVVEANKIGVLDPYGERQDAKPVVAELEHRVPEQQAHDRGVDLVRLLAVAMEREGQRGHLLEVARERRKRGHEALEAVDDDEAVVEEIGTRHLHSIDEDLGRGDGVVSVLGPLGGDGNAAAWAQGLDLRAERELPEIVDGESARNEVFAEDVGDGAGVTGPKGGVGGSEESGGTGPGHGDGGFGE